MATPYISPYPAQAGWLERENDRSKPLEDWELGFSEVGSTVGELVLWRGFSDGTGVWIEREGGSPVLLLSDTDITSISFSFDHTNNPHVAYVAGGVAKWRWWDSLAAAYAVMELPGCRTPRTCTDEKNPALSLYRDTLLSYLKGTDLCVRVQTERYSIEHVMEPDPATHEPITLSTRLTVFGRNAAGRLQWRLE